MYDDRTGMFTSLPTRVFNFEHSLSAISKWEQTYCKSFFETFEDMTQEQYLYYFSCMCMNDDIDPRYLTSKVVKQLVDYIRKPATATTVNITGGGLSGMFLTSEVIYARMAMAQIPFECDKWHISRLITVLNVVSELSNPDKKRMSAHDVVAQNRELNEKRKAMYKTKG